MKTAEPTITCPQCHAVIKLNESLAAPLIESTRREYEQRLAKKDADMVTREAALHERAEELDKAKETLDAEVAKQLTAERIKIASEEARKAKYALGAELDQKARELAELQTVLKSRDEKLAEAQRVQADLLRKQRELDDARRELELDVEKRVQAGLGVVRDQARKEAEEGLKLKVLEKEQTITSMQKQIEDLKRRAEQGSQQLQGEVQELDLEAQLRAQFPRDTIEPVPKGEYGGDALQRVFGPQSQVCGTILWESKRTKNWADTWLSKLRDDQRSARAEIAVLVSQALPKEINLFALVGGVWVTNPQVAIPLAMLLRQSLIDVAAARQATEGQQTKMEMLYAYLTGSQFRQRVMAIVEAFSTMQDDLAKEKKAITKQWAKRATQIERVMQATVGMYGDMQGIAGKTLQEIEGLSVEALAAPASEEDATVADEE